MFCVKYLLCLLLGILELSSDIHTALHPAVNVCKRHAPDINECLCENVDQLMPMLKDGYTEMKIPVTEPFLVDHVLFDFRQSQTAHIIINLSNITIRGFSNLSLSDCNLQFVESDITFTATALLPVLKMNALYQAAGSLSLLELNATGEFNALFTGLQIKVNLTSTTYLKRGKEHSKFKIIFDEFKEKSVTLNLSNLFGNNTQLNDEVNAAIEQNSDALFADMKPIVEETLKPLTAQVINTIFAEFPLDTLFPL